MSQTLPSKIEVGIDISKHSLSVFYNANYSEFSNTKAGITRLLKELDKLGQDYRLTCEATGSYGDLLIRRALENSVSISQVNPLFIKDFIRSFGKTAKTDRIDAAFIARYAQERNPEQVSPKWLDRQPLREAYRFLRQLIKMRSELKASRDKYQEPQLIDEVKKQIKTLDRKIKKFEADLLAGVRRQEELAQRLERLLGVVGVGPRTGLALVLEMPELGSLNRSQVAALAGLAPMHQESGQLRGHRHIRRGRSSVRRVLYMAGFVASNRNPVLKHQYQSLRQAGKPHQVAVIAIARKLLIHLNSILKKDLVQI